MLCVKDMQISLDKDINVTLFLPKNVLVTTKKVRKALPDTIKINSGSDLIINNLGFIYFKDECMVSIKKEKFIETRESIVGGR